MKMQAAGSVRNLCILMIDGTQPGTGAFTVSLRKNGADTALVATIAAGATVTTPTPTCNTSNTVTFASGDLIDLKFTNSASSGTPDVLGVFGEISIQ
jgi:hypothetical protein